MTRRPSRFSGAIALTICTRISAGESLRRICRDDAMPGQATVHRWLIENAAFQGQYARARALLADTLFDQILDIADDATNDWMEHHGANNAGWRENGEAMRRSQMRIDCRKWMAAKLRPKTYGDRPSTGGDPDNPLPKGFSVHLVQAGHASDHAPDHASDHEADRDAD